MFYQFTVFTVCFVFIIVFILSMVFSQNGASKIHIYSSSSSNNNNNNKIIILLSIWASFHEGTAAQSCMQYILFPLLFLFIIVINQNHNFFMCEHVLFTVYKRGTRHLCHLQPIAIFSLYFSLDFCVSFRTTFARKKYHKLMIHEADFLLIYLIDFSMPFLANHT